MLSTPYLYEVKQAAYIETGYADKKGVQHQPFDGWHIFWAAEVPFIPSFRGNDFADSRIGKVVKRQIRFIYDISTFREKQATYELRFIQQPSTIPGKLGKIRIAFVCKVFDPDYKTARDVSLRLWAKFSANFPLEDPFNYPLKPLTDKASFLEIFGDANWYAALKEPGTLLEIRKFEDLPIRTSAMGLGRREEVGDYIVHPLVPSLDFSAMSRFFEALATQKERTVVSICLRPTSLYADEILYLNGAAQRFDDMTRVLEREDRIRATTDNAYLVFRSRVGRWVYTQLVKEQNHTFLLKIQIAGEKSAPAAVAEALGSECMNNTVNDYPTQWQLFDPVKTNDHAIALNNLRYLEQYPWGATLSAPGLERLRYIVTATEACGAFRLPVPPASGFMAGVVVKDEPFVAPRYEQTKQEGSSLIENSVKLGNIIHRGQSTGEDFGLPWSQFARHTLISGTTGSGKTNTCLYLLSQLWLKYRIPFLVIYPIDKPDYRSLANLDGLSNEQFAFYFGNEVQRRPICLDLLVFTLGDETTAPFRFNPFAVGDKVLLKQHISRLMRCFNAAFTMWDPLPAIYRAALRKCYENKGWNIETGKGGPDSPPAPNFTEFYAALQNETASLQYGKETQSSIEQATEIRIRDLIATAGSVVNVERSSIEIGDMMKRPVIMEIGRVGSPQDTALIMGMLLVLVSEYIEHHRPEQLHVTLVEEAHRVMARHNQANQDHASPQGAAGEDFSNLLAEVRGFGEGIIIAEQMPVNLIQGAIGNSNLKLMHRLEDPDSFQLYSQLLNLDERQTDYARNLQTGHLLVGSAFGPVHLGVPNLIDDLNKLAIIDDSGIRSLTATKLPDHSFGSYLPFVPAAPQPKTTPGKSGVAPYPTCTHCSVWNASRHCLFQALIKSLPKFARQEFMIAFAKAVKSTQPDGLPSSVWPEYGKAIKRVTAQMGYNLTEPSSMLQLNSSYCAQAYMGALYLEDNPQDALKVKTLLSDYHARAFEILMVEFSTQKESSAPK
ncbi:hypothetical protein [Candidatus Chlorohelix sp.]|uniref:ATP-binding protein n=1 Tax=Candidatus Chlorohelix sp. TaxID=3139201 RepID=UPI00306017F2